jgi:four helix bundle protein
MSTFKNFEDSEVWKKAMVLTNKIYKSTKSQKYARDYYLVSQLRKSSVSIASNIAEGMERDGNKELINFLYIAKASCGELRCQMHIAKDQDYISEVEFKELYNLAAEISLSLIKLIKYLQNSDFKGNRYK